MIEKQIDLSFKDVNLNAKGYEIDELIKLIKIITSDDKLDKNINTKVKKEPDVEEVDIRELRKSIRYPKTTSNFRCPSCGQGILIKINNKNMLIVRDITGEKPTLYDVEVVELPKLYEEEILKDSLILVYKDLLELKNEEKLLVDTDENTCTCPVCGIEEPIKTWIEAYENPMKYFNHMNVCDICGEEGDIVITQTGNSLICENKCINKIKV